MAAIREPDRVKFICGMISAQPGLFDRALERLERNLGPADIVSEAMPFDLTHYYDHQMGSPLYRKFAAFERPGDPADLAEIKQATNNMEAEFAAAEADDNAPRPVNLDPGYITLAKLVLASMKDFSHRIYLTGGVYAELTLQYRQGRWEPLPWTFPDYASGRYDEFLTAAREKLMQLQ